MLIQIEVRRVKGNIIIKVFKSRKIMKLLGQVITILEAVLINIRILKTLKYKVYHNMFYNIFFLDKLNETDHLESTL